MFSMPNRKIIASDTGFSVEILGRGGLRYVEGDHFLRIDSEILVDPSGYIVYSGSIKHWAPPHNDDPINGGDKERIIENVRAAFRFKGFDIEVA